MPRARVRWRGLPAAALLWSGLLLTTPAGAGEAIDLAAIHGRIQFVDSFPDYRVKVVDSFADLHVQRVDAFADAPGKWQIVDSFPDYRLQLVDSFPDFTIRWVDSFPGVQ